MFAVLLDLLLRPFTKTHTILKDIGSGSFGTVLLTRNKVDNKLYVAKFIKTRKVKELVTDSVVGEDVPLEIYLLSRLSHPNIVSCVGCYKLPQHWVISMKYLENYTDLKTLIKLHGRLTEHMSRTVLIQCYDALVYCFSVGVDHRDIKHQNILVHQTSLHIKLIDFGLSSICDRKTVYTSVQGTELFLPPEALVQRRYTPLESNSWALGCLLYCMVVGKAPFSSKRDVVFTEPYLPDYLSPLCKDLITQCLNKVRHLRVRFESVRWHTWCNVERYRNFLEGACFSRDSTFNGNLSLRTNLNVNPVVNYNNVNCMDSRGYSPSSHCPSSTMSRDMTSHQVSRDMTSHHVTCSNVSPDMTSHHVTCSNKFSRDVTSHHVSCNNMSHDMTSHHVTCSNMSRDMTSHHVTCSNTGLSNNLDYSSKSWYRNEFLPATS